TAFILCYLEGKTNDQAARLLGWPKGTVATRLARARERLRLRLVRHGVTLSTAALGALLAPDSFSAAFPPGLVAATAKMAVPFAAWRSARGGTGPRRHSCPRSNQDHVREQSQTDGRPGAGRRCTRQWHQHYAAFRSAKCYGRVWRDSRGR